MTGPVQPWLPDDAVAPQRIQPAIERMVAEWSRHWFPGAPLRASIGRNEPPAQTGGGGAWRSAADLAAIEFGPSAQAALAGAMLAIPIPASATERDRAFLEAAARPCADDLLKRLAGLAGRDIARLAVAPEPLAAGDCAWWPLKTAGGKPVLRLATSRAALVAIARHGIEPAKPRPLSSRRQAIAAQEVVVSARLGRCAVPLADLHDLAVGDVLVLDAAPEAALDLLLNGRPSPFRAVLDPDSGAARLTLTANQD